MATYKGVDLDTTPTAGMREEAERGLKWIEEGSDAGTQTGRGRARDIAAGRDMSIDIVKRMHSFFARHEGNKTAEGFSPGEDGYPSNGRVAWALWGGDPGQSFASNLVERMSKIDENERDQAGIGEIQYREVQIDAGDIDGRTLDLSVSSEFGVEREFGMEVLSHDNDAIDLGRLNNQAPLLLDHDMRKQIGVVEKAYLDTTARRLRARVRFGKSDLAREILEDVKDGVRANVSIGYRILDMERQNDVDGTVKVSSWLPHEVSVVSVPADPTVGFGRSMEAAEPTIKPKVEVSIMENHITEEMKQAAVEEAKRQFQNNAKQITDLAVKHGRRDLADKAITDGMGIDQFRGVLLDALPEGKPLEQSVGAVDMTAKEQRDYSFMKAVRGMVQGAGLNGLEKEISDEIAKRSGKEAQGFYAPDTFWAGMGKRDLTVGTNSAGGFLKPTDHLGDQFVDALRARTVLSGMGTRFMSGLKGDVAIPKLAGGSAAAFVGENSAVAEQNPTFAQVTMSPKTLGAFVDISRLLMIQSDPSVEQIIRDDLLNALAQKIESVAINGGGSNEPDGILQTSGIGSVAIGTNGGALAWSHIVDLVKEVEQDNAALNGGALRFLTNPKVKAALSQTAKVSSTDSRMILDDPWSAMYGYGVEVTSNVPSNLSKGTGSNLSALVYGDFSQLMIGLFSTADVLIDPYTGGSAGTVRIRVMQEVDTAVRHAESFSAVTDATT